MAYDIDLAYRVRKLLANDEGLDEKAMFGGLAFLVNGNMAIGVSREGGIFVRVDPASTENEVVRAHAAPFVMRGRALDGWFRVSEEGVSTTRALARYVRLGVTFARKLPPKY